MEKIMPLYNFFMSHSTGLFIAFCIFSALFLFIIVSPDTNRFVEAISISGVTILFCMGLVSREPFTLLPTTQEFINDLVLIQFVYCVVICIWDVVSAVLFGLLSIYLIWNIKMGNI